MCGTPMPARFICAMPVAPCGNWTRRSGKVIKDEDPRAESPLDFKKHGDGIDDPRLVLDYDAGEGFNAEPLRSAALVRHPAQTGAFRHFGGSAVAKRHQFNANCKNNLKSDPH